jgi:serine/threonine protein kinase
LNEFDRYLIDPTDYEELREIGRGISSIVSICREKATGALVARTMVYDESDPFAGQHLVRNTIDHLKISSPGMVKLIGFRCSTFLNDPPLIVTELMRNETLGTYLKFKHHGQPIPHFGPTEQSKAVFGIASTMARIHEYSVIVRDSNPSNVFLDENMEIRIQGRLTKIVLPGMRMTIANGPPVFMAPEVFIQDDTYTLAVDVYAYGVLLYQFFTDRLVLNAESGTRSTRNSARLISLIGKGERYPRRPGIPDPFWDLITMCWAHAPSDRPSFEEITKLMLESDDYTFPGTDLEKYHEYRERMDSAHRR